MTAKLQTQCLHTIQISKFNSFDLKTFPTCELLTTKFPPSNNYFVMFVKDMHENLKTMKIWSYAVYAILIKTFEGEAFMIYSLIT